MRRLMFGLVLLGLVGCGRPQQGGPVSGGTTSSETTGSGRTTGGTTSGEATGGGEVVQTLKQARAGFTTNVVKDDGPAGPADKPNANQIMLTKYKTPVGMLETYLTQDPGDGQKHPAIIWITGGDCNSIGDVWSPGSRDNDQSARAFREAGIIMMYPSLRGGNNNPGKREGFYGEVDDILAAADRLAALEYVDSEKIYLGGHSTGGTLVMVVAEMTDRFAGVFSLGPVANPIQYGGEFLYCNTNNAQEIKLRSPIDWMNDVQKPLFVFEGANQGNWEAIKMMQDKNSNSNIQFFKVAGHDHFSVIAPLTELLAQRITEGDVQVKASDLKGLR